MQAPLWIEQLSFSKRPIHYLALHGITQRRPGEQGGYVAFGNLRQQGERLVADSVARHIVHKVTLILAPFQLPLLHPCP